MSKKDTCIICQHTARRTKVDVIEAAWFVLCFEIYTLTTCALSPGQIATRALIPGSITRGCIQPGVYCKVRTPVGSVRRREFGLICISSESCLWSIVGLPDSCAYYLMFRYIDYGNKGRTTTIVSRFFQTSTSVEKAEN